jgi:hypothetical protein
VPHQEHTVKSKEEQDAEESAAKEAAAKEAEASRSRSRRSSSSAEASPEVSALMPGEGFQIPRWLVDAVPLIINQAEQLIQGPGRGRQKKAYVRDALRSLARNHDIEQIPDWVETPVENALIDILVEVVFMTMPLSRKPEKAA